MKLKKTCETCVMNCGGNCGAYKEDAFKTSRTCDEWEPQIDYYIELAENLPEPEKTEFNDIHSDKDFHWLIRFYEDN